MKSKVSLAVLFFILGNTQSHSTSYSFTGVLDEIRYSKYLVGPYG